MKKIISALYLFLSINSVSAQCGPSWLFNSKSTGETWFKDITNDSQNNIITVGDVASGTLNYQALSYSSTSYSEIAVIKSDPTGTILWSQRFFSTAFPSNTQAHPTSVVTDAANNIYVAGFFQPVINFGTISFTSSNWDAFVVKLNATNGNVIWAKKYGSSGVDQFFGIDNKNDLLYLTGTCATNTAFGSYTLNTTGTDKMIAVKMDTSGTVINAASYGGAYGKAIKILPGGDVILSGNYASNFTMGSTAIIVNGSYGATDILVARLDNSTLLPKWVKFGGSSFEEVTGNIDVDVNANIYYAFTFSLSTMVWGSQTLTTHGDKDIAFSKIDSSGTISWTKTFGGPNREDVGDIAFVNNDIITTCYASDNIQFPGSIAISNSSMGQQTPLLAKFDNSGNYISSLVANDLSSPAPNISYYDKPCSPVSYDANQNIYWADRFLNNVQFLGLSSSLTTTNNQNYNSFLLKFCDNSLVSIKEEKEEQLNFNIYPNPNSGGAFSFQIDRNINNAELVLVNFFGQIIHSQKVIKGVNEIHLNKVAQGLYSCILLQDKIRIGGGKIIIE